MKKMKPLQILLSYFGRRPGQGLKEFGAEVKQLSDAEKEWMVTEAAKQLNVEIDRS